MILTETNVSRRTVDWRHGSDQMQANFTTKALVLAQKHGIRQLYTFGVAENANAPSAQKVDASLEYSLMGLYENLNRDAYGGHRLTPQGMAFRTTSCLLQGYCYDPARTAAMALPANVEGGAFLKDGQHVYVLWARTQTDQSEAASAAYSFPAAWNLGSVERHEWDFSSTGKTTSQAPGGITLSGSGLPKF